MSEVTYDFTCPVCVHNHFEAIGGLGRTFRCFSCGQTFTKAQLKKFAEEKLHPNQKRIEIIQIMPSTEIERNRKQKREYMRAFRKTHQEKGALNAQ